MLAAKSAHAAETTDDLIDVGIIDGLRAVFGERTGTLLSRTRQMVTERMPQITTLARGAGGDPLARLAHEIGGMAGQIGMARLSREALALEQLVRDGGDAPALADAALRLEATARDSLASLPAG